MPELQNEGGGGTVSCKVAAPVTAAVCLPRGLSVFSRSFLYGSSLSRARITAGCIKARGNTTADPGVFHASAISVQ